MTRDGSLLLVEDDESLRRVLARGLRGAGYHVAEAGSAEEAVTGLEAGLRPSVVVLDINLPGDTGWDLLRSPAFKAAGSPAVIVATAVSTSPRRLAEFGVAGYLPKPFALETLVAVVERCLTSEDEHTNP